MFLKTCLNIIGIEKKVKTNNNLLENETNNENCIDNINRIIKVDRIVNKTLFRRADIWLRFENSTY